MHDAVALPLTAWESFYVIIGTSAAALTGLMFVVIAMISESGTGTSARQMGAFGTPTVVHFCSALLISAIVSAPWQELMHVALMLGFTGAAGVIYGAIVAFRARKTSYEPVLEDWLFHAVFPLLSYVSIGLAGIVLPRNPEPALFAVGAAAVLLVFIGIHNAWDTVTYVTFKRAQREGTVTEGEKIG